MSAAALLAREPGATYTVGDDPARKVRLHRLYQAWTYGRAIPWRTDRDGERRIIEQAFALARNALQFRGVPQLIPVDPARRRGLGGGATQTGPRLPEVLCVGEFVWARPVRDASKTCSSATLVWFQDSFAPPIAGPVLEDLREVDWTAIAEDWNW